MDLSGSAVLLTGSTKFVSLTSSAPPSPAAAASAPPTTASSPNVGPAASAPSAPNPRVPKLKSSASFCVSPRGSNEPAVSLGTAMLGGHNRFFSPRLKRAPSEAKLETFLTRSRHDSLVLRPMSPGRDRTRSYAPRLNVELPSRPMPLSNVRSKTSVQSPVSPKPPPPPPPPPLAPAPADATTSSIAPAVEPIPSTETRDAAPATDAAPSSDCPSASDAMPANDTPTSAAEPAASSAAPDDDKLCSLEPTFEIDYWQLLPELGDLIGEGGYAEVYKATHNGHVVAVKKFKVDMEAVCNGLPPMNVDLIRREIVILSRLEHPNIMRFYGASVVMPNICLVAEYLERGALNVLLQDGKTPLTVPERLRWAWEVARGLQYLHSRSPIVIHRDIKSGNVLLDKSGTAKLSDFGLAKLKTSAVVQPSSASDSDRPSLSAMVENSNPVGTAGWAAPEMISRSPYNETVDVYSFGVFLWELFARTLPWEGRDELAIIRGVESGERLQLPAEMPPELATLTAACWLQDSHARPSAEDCANRLRALASVSEENK